MADDRGDDLRTALQEGVSEKKAPDTPAQGLSLNPVAGALSQFDFPQRG